ncbi:polysaccharide lyase 8 alpha-helical [Beutenbergia cavernae DSM 12333]|uniref:Polysaccharide lyase 8 alpha-helical n=1 Tax=Beutenbergia cavernae (strain ATCC BAA-8 / DSM 12333 / CCUG 43141 / JCM 11478 / NBRC 16432 / NCIMB 13614 / HKI 0122) TaxID=471853 RepID=C5C5U5_BEUC1|nr:polysaccharide lyase family 8 super-sandwich domain-containing protein [Beutenbergia cavernae]ACQ82303.1 polysaccharide lyase 8 alpha-helical [Beutenbergia cavernae DSM 12333]
MSGPHGISRRNVLIGGLGAAAAILAADLTSGPAGAAWAGPTIASDPAAFAAARERWLRFYLPAGLDLADPLVAAPAQQLVTTARTHLANIDRAEPRLGVFADSPFTSRSTYQDSQRVSYSTRRLREMAQVWAAGALEPDEADAMLTAIQEGLDYLTSDVWSTSGVRFGDWYDWDIAIPRSIHEAVLFVYDALTPGTTAAVVAASKHFTPTIPTSGTYAAAGNRVWFCDAFMGRGLLVDDEADVIAGRDGLVPVIAWANPDPRPPGLIDPSTENEAFFSHDGFYPDGSFVQHGQFPYIGLYGTSYLGSIPGITARTAGTEWEPATDILWEWVWSAYEPWLFRSRVPDTVRGRQIDRPLGSRETGTSFLNGLISLVASADETNRARLESLIKAELAYRGDPPTADMVLANAAVASRILADPDIVPRPPLTGTWVFGVMDRVLHRRADWIAVLAMHSWRMANAEKGLVENKRGWYQADASVLMYTPDIVQYDEGFWATIDSYRIPGVTTDTVARQLYPGGWANEYHNPSYWAGGVTAGQWGAAAIDLAGEPPSTMHGRFSRFFFEHGYVLLGAGITVDAGRTAETTVENRRVTTVSTGTLTVDGDPVDASGQIAGAHWAHLAGTGGYVMLAPHDLTVVKERRSGRLIDINTGLTKPEAFVVREHDYVTLVLPHGSASPSAGYAYAVLPGASAATTAAESTAPRYHVVARTPEAQAVRDEPSGRAGFVFFTPGSVSLVTTDTGAAVALEEGDDELTVHVSDPTQESSSIVIDLAAEVSGAIALDDGVELSVTDGRATLTVDVAGLTGSTKAARLAWNPPTLLDLVRAVERAARACAAPPDQEREAVQSVRHAQGGHRPAEALRALRRVLDAWAELRPSPEIEAAIDLASRLVARVE